jgi:hypothetical protein
MHFNRKRKEVPEKNSALPISSKPTGYAFLSLLDKQRVFSYRKKLSWSQHFQNRIFYSY